MSEEQDIQSELGLMFPAMKDGIRVQRARRIWAEAPREKFIEVFDCLVSRMGFGILGAVTGLDSGATLSAVYHLARTSGVMVNLSVSVPKEKPVLPTVTAYFPAADAYEREMVDLLGMQIEGLPPGSRYPLPDDWPQGQYPLRKDWKVEMLEGHAPPGEMKHG
jgi:membrane-bound hydrogenase subunit beta